MSKSNEENSEGSQSNNNREGNNDNGIKLYEFKSHFSYKSLYNKLELLQIELNNDNRDNTLSCNKKQSNYNSINNMNHKPNRNEGGPSRNILLNHIINNNNDNGDNCNISLDNISLKKPNKTQQIINKEILIKEDYSSQLINYKEKEIRKKDDCNAQTRNLIKNNKMYTSNNKHNTRKKTTNVLFINKKKPTE